MYASGELIHHMSGKTHTVETKRKISEACSALIMTNEQTAKHLIGVRRHAKSDDYISPMLGKTHTDEAKQKISEAQLGKKNHMNISCMKNISDICTSQNILVISDENQFVNLRCGVCDTEFCFTKQMFNASSDRKIEYCPTCHPRLSGTSLVEKQVYDFIVSISDCAVIANDRIQLGGKEIDIFIPSKKIGFEFTGLYWHAEKQNPIKNHLLWKKQFAHNKGIQLITIFEDEWNNKQDITKSRISGLVGGHSKKIHARKCKIVEVDTIEKNEFLGRCHLQGKDTSSINLGLYFDGTLVSIATFKRTNIAKGGDGTQWELSRFCSELYTRVNGAASKLLKYFIKTYGLNSNLISYADSRWSNGELYNTLGFEFVSASPPSYWYTNDYITRKHRSGFMKHRIITMLSVKDTDKTEWEIMQDSGYDRIWDCGTTKWALSNKAQP
jgi:hypothetical protein